MTEGARGCQVAFHLAAKVGDAGRWGEFQSVTVQGTTNALAACRAAGVRRFVHAGSEAALMDGQPLVDADETWPLKPDSPAFYPRAKARAEQAVRAANGGPFETVVVRPRFVWGPDDTTLLPAMVDMVRRGRFAWIGGGRHHTSVTHVDNVIEGLLLGAERGAAGEAYFVTDGKPVEFRDFVSRLLATQGVEAPEKEVSPRLARPLGAVAESTWRGLRLPGAPPLTRFAVWNSTLEVAVDDSKARRELSYQPVVTTEDGLKQLV